MCQKKKGNPFTRDRGIKTLLFFKDTCTWETGVALVSYQDFDMLLEN